MPTRPTIGRSPTPRQVYQLPPGLYTPQPTVQVRRTSAVTIQNDVWTAISWQSAPTNIGFGWRLADPTLLYCRLRSGYYELKTTGEYAANATGFRALRIVYVPSSGSTVEIDEDYDGNPGSDVVDLRVAVTYPLRVGDAIRIETRQNRGGTLTFNAYTDLLIPSASMTWLRDLAA